MTKLNEEGCLAEVWRLRFGETPCPACDRQTGFAPLRKHRAYACTSCGFKLFPCHGTPFDRLQIPLLDWFLAIHAYRRGNVRSARELTRLIPTSHHSAEQILKRIQILDHQDEQFKPPIDWIDAVEEFVSTQLGEHPPNYQYSNQKQETSWNSFQSLLHVPDFERHPFLGSSLIIFIVVISFIGAWLLRPGTIEESQEVAQATAILALAPDSAVLLISQDVADQLYDVTDLDSAPASPLVPVIRVVPTGIELKRIPSAEAKPLSRPSVKLATSVGNSILDGDLTTARKRAAARPELAAYESLAIALEASGPRNPDELLVFGPMKIRRYVVEKIVRAARVTKMDPVLLMAIADKESSFATEVQAQTSSATGLFQFIEKTWLGVVRDFGSSYGLVREAQLVRGDMSSTDRTQILGMRRDPYLSAIFAAEMLKRDSENLARQIGRPLTGGEIYLIHFLGPDGAARLLARAVAAPEAAAADLLPKPAEANKTIFYTTDTSGNRRSNSVSAVREKFEVMIGSRLNRYRDVHSVVSAPSRDSEPRSTSPRP